MSYDESYDSESLQRSFNRENENSHNNIKDEEEINWIDESEKLIEDQKIISESNETAEHSIISLKNFKENNINKLKEEIIYYCSSPETLSNLNFNNTIEGYELFYDLYSENFYSSQKEKIRILQEAKNNLQNEKNKNPKLSNFKETFIIDNSKIDISSDSGNSIKNAFYIITKLDEISLSFTQKDEAYLNESKIVYILDEIVNLFKNYPINKNYLGYVFFCSIENNCLFILKLIDKQIQGNEKLLKLFIEKLYDIPKFMRTNKTIIYLIELLSKNQKFIEKMNLDYPDFRYFELFDFSKLNDINNEKISRSVSINLKKYLKVKGFENVVDCEDFWTINKKEILTLIIKPKYETEESNNKNLLYFKINLKQTNTLNMIIDYDKIELKIKEDQEIIDINITEKNDLLFIFYIIKIEQKKYLLNFDIYIISSMYLLKRNFLELKSDFIPCKLFNDYKYIYCVSDKNEIFSAKKNFYLSNPNYTQFSFNFYNSFNKEKNINEIDSYKEYNNLYLGNYFILTCNNSNKKYLANFTISEENKLILNLDNIKDNSYKEFETKLCNDDNIFVLTKNKYDLLFTIQLIGKNENKLIEKGLNILPFKQIYFKRNLISKNLFKKLIKSYIEVISLYGNLNFLPINQTKFLNEFPFNLCLMTNENVLNFVINEIIINENLDDTKHYYFILLKQIICSLYNTQNLNEKSLVNLIVYLQKLILSKIKDNKNNYIIYNRIIRELIAISSYLSEIEVIKFEEIQNIFNGKIKYKTYFLLIQLLLTQKNSQKNINLYKIIVNIDKKYLEEIYKTKDNNDQKIYELIKIFSLYKETMILSYTLIFKYFNDIDIFCELIPILSSNLEEICKNYFNNLNNNITNQLEKFPIIYYSFNFRLFYLILQKIISIKIFIKNETVISSLYKTLIFLDDLDIDKLSETFDTENIIEIKTSQIRSVPQELKIPIKYKKPQNIIIKSSTSSIKLNENIIQINVIDKNGKYIEVIIDELDGILYKNIIEINVLYKPENPCTKKDIVLNIIPIKDEEKYLYYKNNENNKIINLIQKSILYFFLYFFQDIDIKLNGFNENKIVNTFSKKLNSGIFQFIYIDDINNNEENNTITTDINEISENDSIISKSNEFINTIYNIFGYTNKNIPKEKNFLRLLYENCIQIYDKINIETGRTSYNFNNEYKSNELEIKKMNVYDDLKMPTNNYKKLFDYFNIELCKKNRFLNFIRVPLGVLEIIQIIFEICIKFCNFTKKFHKFMEKFEECEKKEKEHVKNLKNYSLFLEIYDGCKDMKFVYNEEKNRFNDSTLVTEVENYITNIKKKLNFIYQIIIPSKDDSKEFDKSIVEDIFYLIKNTDFKIEELKKYFFVQNLKCNLKTIELSTINNLLLSLKNENSLKLILYFISKTHRCKGNIIMSRISKYIGANYAELENMKKQIHLLLKTLIEKQKLKLSLPTRILLNECLITEFKSSDFHILPNIIESFNDLKKITKSDFNSNFCILEQKNYFNLSYYNLEKLNDIRFEIFKFISSNILSIIKKVYKIKKKDSNLSLRYSISSIKDNEYNLNLEKILSFFIEITNTNKYYYDFILLFYKNLINTPILQNVLMNISVESLIKIINISLNINFKSSDSREFFTKNIMLKLFIQIIENIETENQINTLNSCLINFDNTYDDKKSPFIYIYEKAKFCFNLIQLDFDKKLFSKLALVCLNKLIKNNKKYDDIININDFPTVVFLLNSIDINTRAICEKRFILNNKSKKNNDFPDIALFNSEEDKYIKYGTIICFFHQENLFKSYFEDDFTTYFNKNNFLYLKETDKEMDMSDVLVIMDDELKSKLTGVKNTEIINISNIQLLNDFDDNVNKNINYFFTKKSDEIIKILLSELLGNKLSEYGEKYVIKFLEKLIIFLNKNVKLKLIEYYFQKYDIPKDTSKIFISLEGIQNNISDILRIYNLEKFSVFKEKIDNEKIKKLTNYFSYIINRDSFELMLNGNSRIPIKSELKIEKIIGKENVFEVEDLSFYKPLEYYNNFNIINENSFLFTEIIKSKEDLNDLLNLIQKNPNKIKAIIINKINSNILKNENNFNELKKVNIPIFKMNDNEFYSSIIEFFLDKKILNIEKDNILMKYLKINDLSIKNFNDENLEKRIEKDKFETINGTKIKRLLSIENSLLIKRLIFNLIISDKSIIDEIKENHHDKILYTLESLCMEYYYNNSANIYSPNYLKNIILNSLNVFSNNKKLMQKYINEYCILNTSEKRIGFCSFNNNFKLSQNNNEQKIFEMYIKYPDIIYDKLLYLFNENIISNIFDKQLINKYSITVLNTMKNSIEKVKQKNYKNENRIKLKEDFPQVYSIIFLIGILNSFYDSVLNKNSNSELILNSLFENNFFDIGIEYIEKFADVKDYYQKRNHEDYEYELKPMEQTLIFEFTIKFIDFCLILFLNKKNEFYFKHFMKDDTQLFQFYCNHKILDISNKNKDDKDFKEILTLVAFFTKCIKYYMDNNKELQGKTFEMNLNKLNKYLCADQNKYISFNLNFENRNNINYNKLAIFTKDNTNSKYFLQDILDTSKYSEIRERNISYYYNIKNSNTKELYLTPIKKIPTILFAFGNNYHHSLGINGKLAKIYEEPKKCIGCPKYFWNFDFGKNYGIILCEETHKIYTCGSGYGGGLKIISTSKFTDNNKINDYTENQIINFSTNQNGFSSIINNKGEIFGIGENVKNIFEESNDKIWKNIQKINCKIKAKNVILGDHNIYIIDDLGKLYGLGSNKNYLINDNEELIDNYISDFTYISLPKNCKSYIQISPGKEFILCLIQTNDDEYKIYSKGKNDNNQCGINSENLLDEITELTPCYFSQNLNFKYITAKNNSCAAITFDGDLYTWGNNKNNNLGHFNNEEFIKIPKKVNLNNKIVDKVSICNSHMLIIAKELNKNNGQYMKKLFSCGDNYKGALGQKITTFDIPNLSKNIEEIKIIDEENPENILVPINIKTNENKSFVLCINETELLSEIKNSFSDKDNNEKCYINILTHKDNINNEIIEFYNSNKINEFSEIFLSLTGNILIRFTEILDEMKSKIDNKKITIDDITFKEFYNYISNDVQFLDMSLIFDKNNNKIPENEMKFNFMKKRLIIIGEKILEYCEINEKSEYKKFLKKIILSNISYLSADKRLERFYKILENQHCYSGDIKTITVDRFKSDEFYNNFNESKNKIPDIDLTNTIFGQVFQEFNEIPGKKFLIYKKKRLFKVCLKNEYASDIGGPYHEVISCLCNELESPYLDLFIKTPNNFHGLGLLRDKYIPNPNACSDLYKKAYEFLGKLMASAMSSCEVLNLNLHPIIWKLILGNNVILEDYKSIDINFYNLINSLELEYKNKNKNFENLYNLNFVIKNSNGIDEKLKKDGDEELVTMQNLREYIDLSKKIRLNEFSEQIKHIKKGFFSVISEDMIQVLNWKQVEELVCGKNKIDINDFKKHTIYEDYKNNSEIIKWFWEWFEKCGDKKQVMYLKFVSGRSRLPKSSFFDYKHIIAKKWAQNENAFPNSATCYFTLKLPDYKSKEKLIEKMEYSILNCREIDGDQ